MSVQRASELCENTNRFLQRPSQDLLVPVIAHSQSCRLCKSKLVRADPPIESLCYDFEYQVELKAVQEVMDCKSQWDMASLTPRSFKTLFSESGDAPKIEGYRIVEHLGTGGNGTVWKAYHFALGRFIAIKVMNQREEGNAFERLEKESRILTSIRHAHLLTVFAMGIIDGRLWMGMELCSRGSLQRYLTQPWNPRVAAKMIAQVACAAQAIHERGITHRDIKPGNVLLDQSFLPRLADFDLAQSQDPGEIPPNRLSVNGTPAYMAPEQVRGFQVDHRADIHGMGAVLFHLLTGRPPFQGSTAYEVLLQAVHEIPKVPTALTAKIPRELSDICSKCLQKNPGERFQTAAALADALNQFLNRRSRSPNWLSISRRFLPW